MSTPAARRATFVHIIRQNFDVPVQFVSGNRFHRRGKHAVRCRISERWRDRNA
jgi:hypothetical protein